LHIFEIASICRGPNPQKKKYLNMAPGPNDQKPFSTRLRDTIDQHLEDEGFGVMELAREMGMSHSTLRRKVKLEAGTSISNFICKVRLEKAVEKLDTGSMTISEVAFSCGFQSVSYFVRCFKKMYGTPPGQFRKEHATQHAPEGTNYPIESGLSWKLGGKRGLIIVSVMAVMLIIAISLVFKLTSPGAQDRSAKASIAVLPFRNLNPDEAEMYFINGTMEAILNNLQQIEDLRVPGMTTMERYRDTHLSIQEIAKELGVSYLLEGSGQKSGNRIRLSFALVDAVNDKQVWSEHYDEEIHEAEEIFRLQSSVALRVAREIQVVIRPEEEKKISTIPTKSLNAYYYFQMGREEHNKFIYRGNIHAIENARRFYFREVFNLERDTLALYNGLARIAFSENQYTQAIELGLKGFAIDRFDPWILEILAFSYMFNQQPDKAAEYFEKCLESPEILMERYYLILGPAGYTYWMTGKREQAEILFNEQIKHASRIIEKDLPLEKQESFYRLAAIHSIRGDTGQALSYLRSFSQDPFMVFYRPTMLNHDPSFDNLRELPEFQKILRDINTWYQKIYKVTGSSLAFQE